MDGRLGFEPLPTQHYSVFPINTKITLSGKPELAAYSF